MKIIVTISNFGEDAEKLDFSYIAGGNIKQYSHSGIESGRCSVFVFNIHFDTIYHKSTEIPL